MVENVLTRAGFDGKALVARAGEEATKTELRQRTDEAIERGVFGAPAFLVDGELFWGQDRMDFVAEALGAPDAAPRPAQANAPARARLRVHGDSPDGRPTGRVEFYYDFSSPFAYLASTQMAALANRTGAEVRYRPFLLGGLFKAIGTPQVPLHTFAESKQQHARADMHRFAERYGVPFAFPSRFPMMTVAPLRLVLAAGDDARELVDAIFRAYWADDRDISRPAVLREICRESGKDPALIERTEDPSVKEALKHATLRAAERGLCGAPSFRVGDLLFWGQDRLPFVDRALAGWRPRTG